ncbi:MAG: terminase small subunit, partial [Planctomycetota bacterium]
MTKKKKTKSTKKKSAGDKLNPLQRKFCKLYATDREFFGNGVQAYAETFNKDLKTKGQYKVCATLASRLLKKVDILAYINELLDLSLNEA